MTSECAEMEQEDIEREIFELAREYMEASKLKKLPSNAPNPNEVGLWKIYESFSKAKEGQEVRIYRCPMKY